MIRRLLVLLVALVLISPALVARPAFADCDSDEKTCGEACSYGYIGCHDNCQSAADETAKTACVAVCLSYIEICNTNCSETAASCASAEAAASASAKDAATKAAAAAEKAAAGIVTSDSIEYKTVSQTTYFQELKTQGITFAYVSPDCKASGDCKLEDIMQVFTNIANFILGIVGTLTLAITVYGGFLWLTSQGSSEMIEKGKTAMTGSVVGLLIVFGAFAAINFLTSAFRAGTTGETNKCELISPKLGGMAGTGYACIDATGLNTTTDYTCTTADLCPGATIQCCIKKEPTK